MVCPGRNEVSEYEIFLVVFFLIVLDVEPDVFTYNVVLKAWLVQSKLENSFAVFEEMKAKGIKPDPVTYTTLIATCVKVWSCSSVRVVTVFHQSQNYQAAFELFDAMQKESVKRTSNSLFIF